MTNDPEIAAHPPARAAGLPLGLALAALCLAACRSDDGGRRAPEAPPVVGADLRLLQSPELDEIARLEDARSTGGDRLQEILVQGKGPVRERAATALGRLPFPEHGAEVTEPLCGALDDEDPKVRAAAAFALGMRGDPAAGALLKNYRYDPEPVVRARVVEAAGKLSDAVRAVSGDGLEDIVLEAIRDPDRLVRIEAVLAPHRWAPSSPEADRVDGALLGVLRPIRAAEPPTTDLEWRALFSLQRRGSAKGRGAYVEYADHEDPRARIFAVRGLARLDCSPAEVATLARALGDPDWRVVCEAAVGLGRNPSDASETALLGAVEHRSVHVRRTVLEALGEQGRGGDDVRNAIRRGKVDTSINVQRAARVAEARLSPPAEVLGELRRAASDRDPLVRAGVAEALAHVRSPQAVELLAELATDLDLRVAGQAIQSLGAHRTPSARARLHEHLASPDGGLRLWAVLALGEALEPGDVPYLGQALRSSEGDAAAEIAFEAVRALGEIGGPAAWTHVAAALSHPDPHVRRVAREVAAASFPDREPPAVDPPPAGEPEHVPLSGRDYPEWTRNPIVEVETNRGVLVFELFPAEAPLHAYNLWALARQGHYDGTIFHRVVPDFVVQGGDYRGDGNGAASWRGGSLRHEISPRDHVRGSLGMPRNEDLESGGSQFFVTHRPTPHLDGRYTIFGELRQGGDVLDQIEVGDRIRAVRFVR